MTMAPNFRGTYPMAGKILAPAWQAAWDRLSAGDEWVDKRELIVVMVAAGVAPRTAENLLRAARNFSKIRVRHQLVDSRRRAFYGRKES